MIAAREGGLLAGRSAIVTGASRGIGAAIARRFTAEGARVALVARTVKSGGKLAGSLEEVAATIREGGGECCMIEADLADPASLPGIIEQTLAAFGRLDILINNAAWSRFMPIWEVTERQLRLAFQLNVFTPQMLSQLAMQHMRSAGSGWVLNISSATADLPAHAPWDEQSRTFRFNRDGHPTLYGATKAALDRLTAGWACELADTGISVNALAPVGAVASEGALAVGGWSEEDHVEPVEAMAEAALLLCSRPDGTLSGRIARSLPLLAEFEIAVKELDGTLR
jgi:NAD(P)-dependent dehydrogenase (short-subunit alcohol dehydrogenase family)